MNHLLDVMQAHARFGLPLDPGAVREPSEWTRQQIQIAVSYAVAWADLVETRRSWDALWREFTHGPMR
jgi:hypothetical protein